MVDNGPLQTTAWADLSRARQRLEKAAREVHRHEEIDEPAFQAWLTATFPTLLSAVREAAGQVAAKLRIVQAVEHESFFTGRPPAKIWHEWQQHGGQPPPRDASDGDDGQADEPPLDGDPFADAQESFEEEMRRLFGENGDDENPFAGAFRDFTSGASESSPPPSRPEDAEAREIHRRLVRHLHPDAGGEWTPARARRWEQVQAAWQARDADWLARLEAEWEASTDRLGPGSAISRLRAALREIDAARRDAEKRVRQYRKQDAWRFSLRPPPNALRDGIEDRLRRDEWMLRAQLDELEATLASWERRHRKHARRQRHTAGQAGFGF